MRRVRKLRSLCYLIAILISIVYIVGYMIPAKDQIKMRSNLFILNNQSGQLTDISEEELGGGKKNPEEATAKQLGTFDVQNIMECVCSRKWLYPPILGSRRLNSSCSDQGTHYQTGQHVISFSLFNPQNFKGPPHTSPLNYQIGLFQNWFNIRQLYPGYSLRVYTSVSLLAHTYFCNLLCKNEDIFWCDIRKTPGYGDLSRMNFRTWRFLPLGDPTVNIFHSRDLDSLISVREAAAAQDWLFNTIGNDHKAIMVMRDRKIGHNFPMLAGMWGADNSKLLGEGEKLRNQLILMSQGSSAQDKSFDQLFLSSVLFYPMAKDILAYDSYNCVYWSNFTEVRPFPVRRGDPATDFVGSRVRFSGDGKKWKYGVVECPLECRPTYGLDWIYC